MLSSLFRSKPRVKFDVQLRLDQLSNVPLVNGYLYVKWRLKNGGSASGMSERVQIARHEVAWNQEFAFELTGVVEPDTTTLESMWLALSVRLEVNGGKSSDTLGSVLVDLAEYAGVPNNKAPQTRKYLLRESLLNSTLQLTVTMALVKSMPEKTHYKIPTRATADANKSGTSSARPSSEGNSTASADLADAPTSNGEQTSQAVRKQLATLDVQSAGLGHRRLRSLAPDLNATSAIADAHEVVADVLQSMARSTSPVQQQPVIVDPVS